MARVLLRRFAVMARPVAEVVVHWHWQGAAKLRAAGQQAPKAVWLVPGEFRAGSV
ncbi:MAG: hypothetical protein AAFQ36_11210 [Pseudomonadota bacterium]